MNDSTFDGPKHRYIALGASNVRRGFTQFVAVAERLAGGPAEILTAMGHGRSYGAWSSIPGRALPGIARCGLWDYLAGLPPAPTTALVTDVGNDLLYGVTPAALLAWVRKCVTRLRDAEARIVMTELPLGSLEKLGPRRYQFFRTALFPRCRITLNEMTRRALEVNEGVRALAQEYGAAIEPLPADWYGIDPIHVRRKKIFSVWKKFLLASGSDFALPTEAVTNTNRVSLKWKSHVALQLAAPADRRVLGFHQRHEQPCCRLASGTTVACF